MELSVRPLQRAVGLEASLTYPGRNSVIDHYSWRRNCARPGGSLRRRSTCSRTGLRSSSTHQLSVSTRSEPHLHAAMEHETRNSQSGELVLRTMNNDWQDLQDVRG